MRRSATLFTRCSLAAAAASEARPSEADLGSDLGLGGDLGLDGDLGVGLGTSVTWVAASVLAWKTLKPSCW